MTVSNADPRAVIRRPRLLRELDRLAGRALTLVVGPAGAGKSTLLDQWFPSRNGDTSVRIELESTDPEVLFGALRRALDVDPLAGPFEPREAGDTIVTALADRAPGSPRPLVVVDTGPLRLSEPQVALLDRLVRPRPGVIHLVVAARSRPGFTTGHLVDQGELGLLGDTALAFDRSEIDAVARARLGRRLTGGELDDLATHHQGWVTAVLLSLAAPVVLGGGASEISTARARPLIDDFVLREVLGDLDEEQRRLLFDVAAWDVIVPPVCDAVLDRDDSGQQLDEIAELVTLVQRDTTSSFDFRLAPGFAAVLRREAQRSDPERVSTVARAAAAYHRVRGDRLDGLALLATSGQWDQVIDGLGAIIREPMDGHELRRALVLADSVPQTALQAHPGGLQMLISLELLLGNIARVDTLLAELHGRFGDDDPEQWAARTFWHGAHVAMGPWSGDYEVPLRHAETTLALLAGYSEAFLLGIDEPPFVWARASVLVHGVSSLIRAGRFATARQWIVEGTELAAGSGLVELQVLAAGFEAVLDATVGDLGAAEENAARARVLGDKLPGRSVLTLGAEHASALVALEQHRLSAAEGHLAAMAATEFPHPLHTRALIGLFTAQLLLANGQLRSGLRACDRLRSGGDAAVPIDLEPALTLTEVRLAVLYGQLDHARSLVAASPVTPEASAAAALVRLIDGDHDGLRAVLDVWPSPVGVRGRIEREVFGALWGDRVGDRSACRDHLLRAARLAEPEGFVQVFLDAAPGVAELVRAEHARCPAPVLAALSDRLTFEVRPTPHVAVPELTAFETAVAELLVTHLTGAEMADRLGVSAGTLKSRQRSIYRKLGVHKRSEAVTRLIEHGVVRGP